ncbi:MAG: acetylxylan esterase [Paludibacter sp.]|jgi:hypothetical protein|nr:acetylxylan esterase [Paludibacter sp.]
MKHTILTLSILLTFTLVSKVYSPAQSTQNADNAYARPLSDVLTDIEKRFGIEIKRDAKLIDGKTLNYADWRIKPWSAEESLRAVLAPFDYSWAMDNGKYKIKSFEYPRSNAQEGKRWLDYFSTLYSNKQEWEQRKAEILPCLPAALHLSPMPEKPSSPVILSKIRKYQDYTVQNFAIQTLPGIYVAGCIYRPLKIKGKIPVVLNPNGHFAAGRFYKDIQLRAIMQARMGCVSATWDLFAYGESLLQFDGSMHRLSAANTIQILNGIRILDYLLTLKEADTERVAVTGASGGGSQTMMLSAIDSRIKVSIPVVMMSSYFSGGCPCESGMPAHLCGGRTNNVEIAAMFAPKPQLVISDGKDWTDHVPELEFPFVQHIYGFYDAESQIENAHFGNEGHDYGTSKRQAAYKFLAKQFSLDISKLTDLEGNLNESAAVVETDDLLKVFGKNGELLPANAIKGKDALEKVLKECGIF